MPALVLNNFSAGVIKILRKILLPTNGKMRVFKKIPLKLFQAFAAESGKTSYEKSGVSCSLFKPLSILFQWCPTTGKGSAFTAAGAPSCATCAATRAPRARRSTRTTPTSTVSSGNRGQCYNFVIFFILENQKLEKL
jgi:hypothetical protein